MSSQPERVSEGSAEQPDDEIFIARQPIFDAARRLYAYELLFRSSWRNQFDAADADVASYQMLNSAIHLFGLPSLTNGHVAFINFDRQALLDDVFTLLPRKQAVIEVLEGVEPDDAVVAACRRIKKANYLLALDDCVFADRNNPLWSVADLVKIDFTQCSSEERRELGRLCRERNVMSVAEKVETPEDLQEAKEAGYTYFQGYFFCVPQMRRSRDLRARRSVYLQFLQAISVPEPDYRQIERAIKQDVSLSYKLLRYINAAAVGVRHRVTSIHQALVLLGIGPLRKWGSLVALTGLAKGEPSELLARCLARGSFCERIGQTLGSVRHSDSLFVTGLLSGLPAILHRPMAEVLEEVAVGDEVCDALLGKDTLIGRIYALARACERAQWERVASLVDTLELEPGRVARIHREAADWADGVLHASIDGLRPGGHDTLGRPQLASSAARL